MWYAGAGACQQLMLCKIKCFVDTIQKFCSLRYGITFILAISFDIDFMLYFNK